MNFIDRPRHTGTWCADPLLLGTSSTLRGEINLPRKWCRRCEARLFFGFSSRSSRSSDSWLIRFAVCQQSSSYHTHQRLRLRVDYRGKEAKRPRLPTDLWM